MSICHVRKLSVLLLALAIIPGIFTEQLTAEESDYQKEITPEVLDHLAKQIGCTVANVQEEGAYTYAYDVAAYERIKRKDTEFGTYQHWDYYPQPNTEVGPKPEYTVNEPYENILEGFRRGGFYHPDTLGLLLREHNILATDAPGNGLYESLRISKKYGLRHVFFTPTTWVTQPFQNEEMVVFKKKYDDEVEFFTTWLQGLEDNFDVRFLDDPDQPWVVQVEVDDEPLDVFHKAIRRDYAGVKSEFQQTFGFDMPLMVEPATAEEKAQRIKFWWWILDKYSGIAETRMDILEDHIGRHLFTGNVHFSTIVDYDRWGEIYDMPGISPRPILAEDPLAWKYLMGYSTRLLKDLTDSRIMTAPRTNMVAAGARIVPTPGTIKYWYSQVARNGGDTFFIWIRDFSSNASGGAYSGPALGNPDKSTLGELRWKYILKMSKLLGNTKKFQPPQGETAILVSMDTGMLYGWKNIFSAYIELTKAGVWSNFISDKEIWTEEESLDDYKVLYIPVMEFTRKPVLDAIRDYVTSGGIVVTSDPKIFSYTLEAEDISEYRRELFGLEEAVRRENEDEQVKVDVFNKRFNVQSYDTGYELEPNSQVQVLGRYEDNSPAIISKQVGKGRTYFLGTGIMDIYAKGISEGPGEDTGRYVFYKSLEEESGAEDLSWIWNITVDNIQQVTGVYQPDLPKIDEDIQFRLFMYPHGDWDILKYFYSQ